MAPIASVPLEEATRVPRARRFRFSLRTFFVSLLLLSLIGSNLYVSWRWHEARKDVERLREELGILTIDDPTKFHVRELPTHVPLNWRWRIYVPPGNHWLHVGSGRVPKADLGAGAVAVRGPSSPIDPLVGEYTMTARVERDQSGKWQLVVSWPDGGMTTSINEPDASWLPEATRGPHIEVRRKYHVDIAGGKPVKGSAGKRQTETFSADEPVMLLRLRAPEDLKTHTSEPCDGLIIWFDNGPNHFRNR